MAHLSNTMTNGMCGVEQEAKCCIRLICRSMTCEVSRCDCGVTVVRLISMYV